jgi:hypothetical protein
VFSLIACKLDADAACGCFESGSLVFCCSHCLESRLMLSMHRNRLYSRSFSSVAPRTADLVTAMYFTLLLLQHRMLLF